MKALTYEEIIKNLIDDLIDIDGEQTGELDAKAVKKCTQL